MFSYFYPFFKFNSIQSLMTQSPSLLPWMKCSIRFVVEHLLTHLRLSWAQVDISYAVVFFSSIKGESVLLVPLKKMQKEKSYKKLS